MRKMSPQKLTAVLLCYFPPNAVPGVR